MTSPIKTFQVNTEGRDFAIGDLHGCYELLQKLLDYLDFDPLKDRLFSVGDLIDRGPESLRCLELLHEPWFHAVRDNHSAMMLEAFRGGRMGQYWIRNGGAWGLEALVTWINNRQPKVDGVSYARPPSDEEHRLYDLLPMVEALPFLATVDRKDGSKVHLIHAELPIGPMGDRLAMIRGAGGWDFEINDKLLTDPERLMQLVQVQSDDGDFVTWGRYLFRNFYRANLADAEKVKRTVAYLFGRDSIFNPRLSHIISGHTIVQRPLTILGQTNLDTGAYGCYDPEGTAAWEALTCVDINAWKFYQARPSGVTEVEPVVVTQQDVDDLVNVVRPPPVNTPPQEGTT